MDTDGSTRTVTDRLATNRRQLLGALGAGAIAATSGCMGVGGQESDSTIDPTFGYAGTSEDEIPESLTPDHTVDLHVDEEQFIMRDGRPVGVEFGAFHFEYAGLHVEPGDVVTFRMESPDHTITALHQGLGRQQRVPDGVPWFSSPVIGKGGFWLYSFDEPGVYDVVCAPHELLGMAMRIVVGDETDPVVRGKGRPPESLSAALLGTGMPGEDGSPDRGVPPLAPENIVEAGTVGAHDIPLDLAVEIPMPTRPSEI